MPIPPRPAQVRVYVACSLDGFIAGPDHDLSWLPGADGANTDAANTGAEGSATPEPHAGSASSVRDIEAPPHAVATPADAAATPPAGAVGFEQFLGDVGALLMGRGTYDVVAGFGDAWAYGDRPVLVATHRELESPRAQVRRVSGDIRDLVGAALTAAAGKDVYIDGGNLIRQALDAELIDDVIVTLVPVVLGAGHALFAGSKRRHTMEFLGHHSFEGGMVQLHARPRRRAPQAP
ncbi:MAG TPA: dihydrofolate reductase family protein [Polyangiaceae bacterium]|nr:dihydrofolate reductase family protein [Polyangiaceae bacterium]